MRAKQARLAELSAVASCVNRLKKSQAWLLALCVELSRERGVELNAAADLPVRATDVTTLKEPGKTGSQWRVHYSVRLPSLACDFFRRTATAGGGTGASLVHSGTAQGSLAGRVRPCAGAPPAAPPLAEGSPLCSPP